MALSCKIDILFLQNIIDEITACQVKNLTTLMLEILEFEENIITRRHLLLPIFKYPA